VVERTYWIPESSREALDWEAPMEPVAGDSGATPSRDLGDDHPAAISRGPEDNERAASAEGDRSETTGPPRRARRDSSDARGRRSPGKTKETRRVDLKLALLRLEPAGPDPAPANASAWTLELWLDHPGGHVANPRVVLEQLFHLSPEEQARVRVTREAILGEDGTPLIR
jgi:hypothetical protein